MAAVMLRVGISVLDIADASREAIEEFLRLAPTKADLAGWLRGPYRRATAFVPQPLRSLATREQAVSDEDVADIVHHAQCAVRQAIAAAVVPGAEGIARSLPDVLHLASAIDAEGAEGFAPVDVPGTCLADRVLALIVAEYLTRPDEFVDAASSFRPLRAAQSGKFPTVKIDTPSGEAGYGSKLPFPPNRSA